jgi:hypothetical protein
MRRALRLCLVEARYVPYHETSAVHTRAMDYGEEAISSIIILIPDE